MGHVGTTSLPMHSEAGQLEMRVNHEDADQLSKLGSISKRTDIFSADSNVLVGLKHHPRPPNIAQKQRNKVASILFVSKIAEKVARGLLVLVVIKWRVKPGVWTTCPIRMGGLIRTGNSFGSVRLQIDGQPWNVIVRAGITDNNWSTHLLMLWNGFRWLSGSWRATFPGC